MKYVFLLIIGILIGLMIKNKQNGAMWETLRANPQLCPPCCSGDKHEQN